jgi:8-oxo-dGTP diphosphatase
MTTVVAAVIERKGELLICQRRSGDSFALKWEFPGGKTEKEENPRVALKRELKEELGIDANIGAELGRYEHQYPNRQPILIIFYAVSGYKGEPQNLGFEEIRWEQLGRLHTYDFLEADVEFVQKLGARGKS